MAPLAAQLGDAFVPGTMLGKYELLATIGTGGMANVILARQRGPGGFEKIVVIKVIHPHMAQDAIAIQMLLDEARVAAQIDHPNVVHTHELGEAAGTYYIAMEYLAGESFAQVIKLARTGQSPLLTPYLAARIVADAAEGLHFAHDLRDFTGKPLEIVHRDLSPGNIVVLYSGAVKVVDFGIAKAHGRVTSTQDGELKGKYGYMSPEQINNETLDRRSDVFSLGVCLWESLAQRRLFQADSVGATLMKIIGSQRVPPSYHRPEVPPALDAIALKALAPNVHDRWQSAGEMKQAIDDVIWQARVGANEIAAHMTAHFSTRMEERRALLARATSRDHLERTDLARLSAVFRDVSHHERGSQVTPPAPMAVVPAAMPAAAPDAGSKKLAIATLGGAILLGVLAGVVVSRGGSDGIPPGNEPVAAVEMPVETPAVDDTPAPVAQQLEDPPPAPTPTVPTTTEAEPDPEPPVPTPTTPPTVAVADPQPAPSRPRTRRKPEPSSSTGSELYKQATDAYLAGKFDAAESAYRQATKAGYAPAYRGLGFLYQRTGNKAKAIDALRTYLRLQPNAKDAASVKNRLAQLGAE